MSADLNAIKARWAASRDVRRKYPEETGGPDLNYSALFIENAFANHAPGETNDPTLREVWRTDSVAYSHAPEDIAALIQALEEVRDALMTGNTYGGQVESALDVLERRMGADWLNGRGESERLASACKCGDCYHPVIGPNTDGASCDWCQDCACPIADHTRMTYVKESPC